MVAQQCNSPIGPIVGQYLGSNVVVLVRQLLQLFLECNGCVVGTEHLGSETRHEAVQILVQNGGIEPVEEVVAFLFAFHKQLEILEDAFFDGDVVVVTDRILTQEIKFTNIFFSC